MNNNAMICEWLHSYLDALILLQYPFDLEKLPKSGIYFFYEQGEAESHRLGKPRIVRVGTHRKNNFRSRIAEHFLLNERKMCFTQEQPAPHERSIFRKHIGRALLSRAQDPYLSTWEIDFTTRTARYAKGHLRDIPKEKAIESQVTQILRQNFSFKFIEIASEKERLGEEGLERALIGTLAGCGQCRPSGRWLGQFSPDKRVSKSGLWLVQHLTAAPLSAIQKDLIVSSHRTSNCD